VLTSKHLPRNGRALLRLLVQEVGGGDALLGGHWLVIDPLRISGLTFPTLVLTH
jgi:hypothetical protein